jgi:TetR/AcrR family transcriptional regulator, tetracycline repressor protein
LGGDNLRCRIDAGLLRDGVAHARYHRQIDPGRVVVACCQCGV